MRPNIYEISLSDVMPVCILRCCSRPSLVSVGRPPRDIAGPGKNIWGSITSFFLTLGNTTKRKQNSKALQKTLMKTLNFNHCQKYNHYHYDYIT